MSVDDLNQRKKNIDSFLKTFLNVITLGGLIVHGIFEPSKIDMERVIDRGAIPAAFGGDMLLEFSLIICIYFHKWIDPAIATAVDASQIFVLACAILVVIESIWFVFKIVIAAVAGAAIGLHIYLIIKNTFRIKKRRAMSPPKSAIPPWGDPRDKAEKSKEGGEKAKEGKSKGKREGSSRGTVRNRRGDASVRRGNAQRGNSKKRR